MDRQWLLCSAFLDFDSCYGNAAILKRVGLEDFTIAQTVDFMLAKDVFTEMNSDMVNLQRCLMTLNGVATTTGAGNLRPSKMWKAQAIECLARED